MLPHIFVLPMALHLWCPGAHRSEKMKNNFVKARRYRKSARMEIQSQLWYLKCIEKVSKKLSRIHVDTCEIHLRYIWDTFEIHLRYILDTCIPNVSKMYLPPLTRRYLKCISAKLQNWGCCMGRDIINLHWLVVWKVVWNCQTDFLNFSCRDNYRKKTVISESKQILP